MPDEVSDNQRPGEPVDHFPKGTGRPASGAFVAADYHSLDDLAGESEAKLAGLHGVGPRAIGIVKAALAERGLELAP